MESVLRLVLAGALAALAAAESGWKQGRVTMYGNEPWLWSIHSGSCGYDYIYPDEPLGWDIAALSDSHPDFAGSCGRCYEIKCDPSTFTDSFGNELVREDVCYHPNTSMVVRTTDTCPCNYNDNYYSNKRWCCGDMDHMDISVWAFEKMADTKWGVLGMQYRAVPCDYQPENPTPAIDNPFPGEDPPFGAVRTDRWGGSTHSTVDTIAEEERQQVSAGTDYVFRDGGSNSNWSGSHWYSEVDEAAVDGMNGGKAVCGQVYPGGALSFSASKPGRFVGKMSMEIWVKTDERVPEIDVNLSGGGQACRSVRIQDLNSSGQAGGWSRYDIYLGLFAATRPQTVVAFASAFEGCGSTPVGDLDRIEIRNDRPYMQTYCVDEIKLIGE